MKSPLSLLLKRKRLFRTRVSHLKWLLKLPLLRRLIRRLLKLPLIKLLSRLLIRLLKPPQRSLLKRRPRLSNHNPPWRSLVLVVGAARRTDP